MKTVKFLGVVAFALLAIGCFAQKTLLLPTCTQQILRLMYGTTADFTFTHRTMLIRPGVAI